MLKKETIVISLGGSLISTPAGVNAKFLKQFNAFIRTRLNENPERQFFIVVGGGAIARAYRDAGAAALGGALTDEDLDWLGIHATRLNAHLLRTIFRDIAHPAIIKDYGTLSEIKASVVISAGWKPGWSTDYDAVLLCERYGVKKLFNLSNIDYLYDKDPKTARNAKTIRSLTWKKFRVLVGSVWHPGMNAPFDPIAAKKAESLGLTVIIAKGDNIKNLEKIFTGKYFDGTTISP